MSTLIENFDIDIQIVDAQDADYHESPLAILASMAFQIFLIREFEQALLNLYADNCMHGPLHTSIGQEACAAGSIGGLQPNDKVSGSHRSHHIYLSKTIGYYFADGLTDYKQLPDDVQQEITSVMGEIMGLANGCCQGRGGSMHLFNKKIGMIGSNAIVSGGVPAAAGAAFADQYKKQDSVTISFTGDGGVNQGAFHEALNLAGVWKLPFICFIENNQYAVATSVADSTATEDLAVKAVAYGMKGLIVDGMDPMAVRKAVLIAGDHARAGNGATLLEAKCYRYQHHGGGSAKGSQFGYRDTDEEDQWVKRDPYTCFPDKLIDLGLMQPAEIEELKQLANRSVEAAITTCTLFEDNHYSRREELWPKVETIYEGSRSDGKEFDGIGYNELEDFTERKTVNYVGAIAAVTGRQMEKDENVVVLGEEVANLGGGAYGATKGLYKIYPDRIVNTPISEGGFTGLAGGAALMGLKPVVELMFSDFGLVAADQLFNQIGKLRFMYGNASRMPIIVRTRVAIGGGYGGQHSSDPVGLYSLYSGWRIVAPSSAFDYIGLFNTAMLSEDPVLISEHHTLYPVRFEVPTDNLDYFIPFGKARRITEGSDVTVLCYSSTVGLVAKAIEGLEAEGVSAEVIDLRTISLGDIDYETIGASLKKTKAMVIVEQAQASCAIGPRLSHECQQRFFDYLDGPITTVNGLDIPLPVSKRLEDAAVPNTEQARDTIVKTANRRI